MDQTPFFLRTVGLVTERLRLSHMTRPGTLTRLGPNSRSHGLQIYIGDVQAQMVNIINLTLNAVQCVQSQG